MDIDLVNGVIQKLMVYLPFFTGILIGVINMGLFKQEYEFKEWLLLIVALCVINYVVYVLL